MRKLYPTAALLFLSRDESVMARFSALEAGAAGYLIKSQAADELVGGVRLAAAGQVIFSAQNVAELLAWRRESADLLDHLTARSHVRSLVGKLAVHSRLHVLVKAADLGLVDR